MEITERVMTDDLCRCARISEDGCVVGVVERYSIPAICLA